LWRDCASAGKTRQAAPHQDDATFKRAKALFGEQGVIDLIGVSGYYTAVSMTLNVAEVPVPGGVLPLKPLD
jgi:4-carboxymuconolactone decarboxylase